MYACILIVWTGVDAVLLVNVGLRYAQPVHVGRQEHDCDDPDDGLDQGVIFFMTSCGYAFFMKYFL